MSHYAKIVDNVVTEVIAADQNFIDLHCEGTWVQTSYNTSGGVHYGQDGEPDSGIALRKNYAQIGHVYDIGRDAFRDPQPYPSWTLDKNTCYWEPPVPKPDFYVFHGRFVWDEETASWVKEYHPQPFNSWSWNEGTEMWEAPVPHPDEGVHTWDEEAGEWVEVE